MQTAIAHADSVLREDTLIRFHPLFLCPPERTEDAWKVGVEKTTLAIELPLEGVRAIQILQEGRSLAETSKALQQEFGEDIDLIDLVQTLAELELVAYIDDHQLASPERVGQRWLERIPPATVRWLYSPMTLTIFAALICAGPILLLLQPSLRPHAQDMLWTPSYVLNLLTLLIIGPLLVFKHELGHLLTARAKGLPAELTFGHRFFYLVAVSRIGEIWKCSRRERLLIYSAGMINDAATASLCLLLLFANTQHMLALTPSLAALLRLLVLSEYQGIAWQFQIFLKTDVYHIFTELTNRHDLPDQVSSLLRSGVHLVFPSFFRSEPDSRPVVYDTLMIGYTLLSVIGIAASCIWLVIYGLPATFIAFQGEITLLLTSIPTNNMLALFDSIASLLMQSAFFVLLGISMTRKQHRSRTLQSQG